jgi:hypothetical protein
MRGPSSDDGLTPSPATMLNDEQRDRIKDIARLIASEEERRAFLDMLAHKLRGREELADSELRRVAERTWREFLQRGGWAPNIHGP